MAKRGRLGYSRRKLSELTVNMHPEVSRKCRTNPFKHHQYGYIKHLIMDHLSVPHDPALDTPRVPYVCTEPYDGLNFATYPHRTGWSRAVPLPNELTFAQTEMFEPSNDRELERFLQNWVFFGLLHELLNPHRLYFPQDFVDEQGPYVHTRLLVTRIQRWLALVESLDDQQKFALGKHLHDCLWLATRAMQCLLVEKHRGFDRNIKMSLLAVCESISGLGDTYLDFPGLDWPLFDMWILWDPIDEKLLLKNGWCPSEMKFVRNEFSTVAGKYYLDRIQKPKLDVTHDSCKVDGCAKLQIDPKNYKTRHTSKGCKCKLIGPDQDVVARLLDQGSFPVLEIDATVGQPLSIQAVPYGGSEAYIALSHVWVDGLGNQKTMQLPACQIQRLNSLVKSVEGQTYEWHEGEFEEKRKEQRNLLLWCDTLCCPTITDLSSERQKELKKAAIDRLKEVYQNAAYVLVLDRALEAINFADVDALEAAVLVSTSRWSRRLWTFQEGALAKKILINFSDQIVDLREIRLEVREIYRKTLVRRYFARQVFWRNINLSAWFRNVSSDGPELLHLAEAVRYRRVSISSDEPLCLAAAMQLDISQVTASDPEIRMEVFWRLLGQTSKGVSKDIIFNILDRLPTPGFRWAPGTLQQPSHEWNWVLSNYSKSSRAELTPYGLRVKTPAFRILPCRCPYGVHKAAMELREKVSMGLMIRSPDDKWYSTRIQRDLTSSSISIEERIHKEKDKVWYLILDSAGVSERQLAVLATAFTHDERTVYHSQAILSIHELHPSFEVRHRIAHKHGTLLKKEYDRLIVTGAEGLRRLVNFCYRWDMKDAVRKLLQEDHAVSVLVKQLRLLIIERAKAATNSDENFAASVALDPGRKTGDPLIGHVLLSFTGGLVEIQEKYPADSEWCVD